MPETQTHKRKRSHQGIPTDMRERMMSSLDVLREKYSGIEKTEEEMAEVEKNIDECHRFLEERIKVTFSDASKVELENLNVKTGQLIFNPRKIDQLAQARAQHVVVGEQLKDLGSRLQKIYRRVNTM